LRPERAFRRCADEGPSASRSKRAYPPFVPSRMDDRQPPRIAALRCRPPAPQPGRRRRMAECGIGNGVARLALVVKSTALQPASRAKAPAIGFPWGEPARDQTVRFPLRPQLSLKSHAPAQWSEQPGRFPKSVKRPPNGTTLSSIR
jgi:hypothetical protein